ncbi:MAG TPA: hypothetical protein VIH57_15565 [Bacteroidales bacterium]
MKKLVVCPVFLVLISFVMFSCKKDDDSASDYVSGLAGGWKYISGNVNERYLQIYRNNTCSILYSDAQGLRNRSDAIVTVTNNQITIYNPTTSTEATSINIYNYTLKGDTLTLSQPYTRIKLALDKTAPDTSAWIKTLTAQSMTKAPVNEATDITFDGTSIWYGNGYSSHYIYKIDPHSFSTDSVMVSQYAWAVEADGNNLWLSSDGSSTISEVNKSTGNTITTSIGMGAWIYGIAKDNNFMWCYSDNEDKLYKYNTTTNTVDLTVNLASRWDGMAIAGGYLYVASNGKLNKCTLSPLMETSSFELPGYYIFGVAFDGTSFWVSAYQTYGQPQIIKVGGVE